MKKKLFGAVLTVVMLISTITIFTVQSATVDFIGSSLGNSANVKFAPEGGQHNLQTTYKSNTNETQSTAFVVCVFKNKKLVSAQLINKIFAPNEEYTFTQNIYIPATNDNSYVEVDFLLWDGLRTLTPQNQKIRNIINNKFDYSANGSYPVQILEYLLLTDNSRSRKVPIKIHMPSSDGIFPAVIISHGAGGNWDTHYAQAEHLASNGYIVLCLEHVGSNTTKMLQGESTHDMTYDSNEVLNRPKDVSFAIDTLINWNNSNSLNNKIRGRVDIQNIGMMGHSYGAYTTMAVCGMRPALDYIVPAIAPGYGIGPDLSDHRIKCGIALSPQGADAPFFIQESFNSLRVPLMGMSGTNDDEQNGEPATNRYNAFQYWSQNDEKNKFVWIANAAHLDFTDSTGSQQTQISSKNRDEVQKVAREASLLYFNWFLKGDSKAQNDLTTNGLLPFLSGEVNNVEVRSK